MPGLDLGRRYAKDPIVQALVEFNVRPGLGITLDALAALDFGENYGDPEPISTFEQPSDADGDDGEPEEYEAGFSFGQKRGLRRVHATADRFTFIARGDYGGWELFIAEVEQAWVKYREATAPIAIEMIGVRYTNHILLPDKAVELKDYLRTGVEISSYLPQAVASMFLQIEVPLPDHNATATITSALMSAEPEKPGGGVLLDIDIKSIVQIATQSEEINDSLPATLDKLRLAKNYVFEACITDATRGLIDNGG